MGEGNDRGIISQRNDGMERTKSSSRYRTRLQRWRPPALIIPALDGEGCLLPVVFSRDGEDSITKAQTAVGQEPKDREEELWRVESEIEEIAAARAQIQNELVQTRAHLKNLDAVNPVPLIPQRRLFIYPEGIDGEATCAAVGGVAAGPAVLESPGCSDEVSSARRVGSARLLVDFFEGEHDDPVPLIPQRRLFRSRNEVTFQGGDSQCREDRHRCRAQHQETHSTRSDCLAPGPRQLVHPAGNQQILPLQGGQVFLRGEILPLAFSLNHVPNGMEAATGVNSETWARHHDNDQCFQAADISLGQDQQKMGSEMGRGRSRLEGEKNQTKTWGGMGIFGAPAAQCGEHCRVSFFSKVMRLARLDDLLEAFCSVKLPALMTGFIPGQGEAYLRSELDV